MLDRYSAGGGFTSIELDVRVLADSKSSSKRQ